MEAAKAAEAVKVNEANNDTSTLDEIAAKAILVADGADKKANSGISDADAAAAKAFNAMQANDMKARSGTST